MNNFNGYLLKFGNTVFPHSYIQYDTYKPVPSQRTELSAYRDNNNELHRTTSPNHKTTLKFTTRQLHLEEKIAIQQAMRRGLINEIERKYNITYWNDETNEYIQAYFYMPDVTYSIIEVKDNDVIYRPIDYEFIEY